MSQEIKEPKKRDQNDCRTNGSGLKSRKLRRPPLLFIRHISEIPPTS
jgi:hypothetical protein